MTPEQLQALQSYVSATVRVMMGHANAHSQNLALFVTSRRALEAAFGKSLPSTEPKPPAMPDLL